MSNRKVCITCSQEYPADESICLKDGSILRPVVKDKYVGTTLCGRYDVLETIGNGGMGLVYKANDRETSRVVAIKVLHQHLINNNEAVKRFQIEAKAASSLSSPNILTIYDFGVSDEGQPFMVMDYLEGISLADVLEKERRLTVRRSLKIFSQTCSGLAQAHKNGVLHRDLKPSNIMLVNYGEDQEDFVKIVDFGIAKILKDDGNSANLTRTGEVYGSPLYMSPEQCRGQELDARSDLYSFGCVMYKTLSGYPVFTGSEVIEFMFKQVSEMPAHFGKICPEDHIPIELEEIVFKTLAKSQDDRYASMSDLKDVLDNYRKKLEGDGSTPAVPYVVIGAASSLKLGAGRGSSGSALEGGADHTLVTESPIKPQANSLAAAGFLSQTHAKSGPPSLGGIKPAEAGSIATPLADLPAPTTSLPKAAMPEPATAMPMATGTGPVNNHRATESSAALGRKLKGKPDWVLLIEGTLANRLVLTSLAGLIIATAAVAWMLVNAERSQHVRHAPPPSMVRRPSAPPQTGPVVPVTESRAHQVTAGQPTAEAIKSNPTESDNDQQKTGNAKRHHQRAGHRARHAYSSYGF